MWCCYSGKLIRSTFHLQNSVKKHKTVPNESAAPELFKFELSHVEDLSAKSKVRTVLHEQGFVSGILRVNGVCNYKTSSPVILLFIIFCLTNLN